MKNLITTKLLRSLYLFLIVGFCTGLAIAVSEIMEHEYIAYGTYNLTALSLWWNITYYTLAAIVVYIVFIILGFLIRKISLAFKSEKEIVDLDIPNKILVSLVISLAVALIVISLLNSYSREIIKILKSSAVDNFLGNFSDSPQQTNEIYKFGAGIFGFVFFLLFSYIPYRFGISAKVLEIVYKLSSIRTTAHIALSFLVVIIALNLYVYSLQIFNTPKGPNILLISIDTLRTDRLSSYGHGRNTSPNIDKLAEEGILFENAYSQSSWTLPAMATIHTSLYPTEHGAVMGTLTINNNLLTLGEYMKDMNYKTMAITTHSFVDFRHGFGQGFDKFFDRVHKGKDDISSKRITEQAIEILNDNKGEKFFFWVHYFDPHSDYMEHQEYIYAQNPSENIPDSLSAKELNGLIKNFEQRDVEYINDIYDEEISYTDKNVGDLLNEIEKLGLKNDTVVILTVDHGEELLDRSRYGHGKTLYNELIHVPLIIYNPSEEKIAGKRVENIVETRNIARTIEDILGSGKSFFGGENLIEIAKDEDKPSKYAAYSEGKFTVRGTAKHTVIKDNWKLIRNLDENTYEFYNLESDPGETENLFFNEEPQIEAVRQELYTSLSNFKKSRKVELERVKFSKEELKELKALGYME